MIEQYNDRSPLVTIVRLAEFSRARRSRLVWEFAKIVTAMRCANW